MSSARRQRRKIQREYEKYLAKVRRDAFKRAEQQKGDSAENNQ